MVDLPEIRQALGQWGRICKWRGLGYPTMSTTAKAAYGRGGIFTGPSLPPDLELIDLAVSRSKPEFKRIVVESYTKDGSAKDHAVRLRLSVRTYWRRRTLAETNVGRLLQVLAQ